MRKKTINGAVFIFEHSFSKKSSAIIAAEKIRAWKKGNKARIIKSGKWYEVWTYP
jgi:predicted GIY-YIG superfamily endonuclease